MPQRPRAAHAQVVDRAVHGDPSNVTTREEERADHVGVCGERKARAPRGHHSAVMLLVQRLVLERGPENAVDQFLREAAAPAVAHRDFGPMGQGNRTGCERNRGGRLVRHKATLLPMKGRAEKKSRQERQVVADPLANFRDLLVPQVAQITHSCIFPTDF